MHVAFGARVCMLPGGVYMLPGGGVQRGFMHVPQGREGMGGIACCLGGPGPFESGTASLTNASHKL